jgi:peptidoglycan/xylan/chitin deacetylase (PgdA/CDA1 family)
MPISAVAKEITFTIDRFTARASLAAKRERPGLLTLMFHGIFPSHADAYSGTVQPPQRTTIQSVSRLIEYFHGHGYRFVSPNDFPGLTSRGYYVLLTFDDGYFNNLSVLSLLGKYDIPAVFFISTAHVRTGKAFWWDVVRRRCRDLGYSPEQVPLACLRLQKMRTSEIESFLIERLGLGALTPVGDFDRPMTSEELETFAEDPHVHLGNHTDDHASLNNYSEDEIRQQIAKCQDELKRMTGKSTAILSYPHGNYSPTIVHIAASLGLRAGVTCLAGKAEIPIQAIDWMSLRRNTVWENQDQLTQYQLFRSDIGLYPALSAVRRRFGSNRDIPK